MESLEHGHIIAFAHQIPGTGKACGAGTDDGALMAVGCRLFGGLIPMRIMIIGGKTFQTADTYGFTLDAPDAALFALIFLGADPAAYGGQCTGTADDLISFFKLTLGHMGNKFRNMNVYGAAGHAGHVFAVQAAGGLVYSLFSSVAQGYFLKIAGTDFGILGGHFIAGHFHVRHTYCTSCLNRLQASSLALASKSR